MELTNLDVVSRKKKCAEKLDNTFLGFFPEAEKVDIPTILERETLEKCGYFGSFPDQLLTVGSVLESCCHHVMETNSVGPGDLNSELLYLTPAACLNIYPLIQEQRKQNRILTAKTHVYRKEKEYVEGVRQIEFTVREFVFSGTAAFVKAALESARKQALAYAKCISPQARLDEATDPFYPTPENMLKARFQQRNAQKKELLIPVGAYELACASFNDHDVHFSEAFGFDSEGHIVTGCAGFGIERWTTALLAAEEIGTNEK